MNLKTLTSMIIIIPVIIGCAGLSRSKLHVDGGSSFILEIQNSLNQEHFDGSELDADTSIPVSGIPTPLNVQGDANSLGMFSTIDIKNITGPIEVRIRNLGNQE